MIPDDLIDADALAAGLAGLQLLLDFDDRRAVVRIATVEPEFVAVEFSTGEVFDIARGFTHPFLAETLFTAAAARAGRLEVKRH